PIAGDVERRNGYRGSGKGSQQFPAAIHVAVKAEGTTESGPREFRDINIDVGLRDPGRQGCRIGQKTTLPGQHPFSKPSGLRGRRTVARERVELGTDRLTHVAAERRFGLGGPEVELVEDRILVLRHERRRRDGGAEPPFPEWHAERDDSTEEIRAQNRRLPSYRSPGVVTGAHRLLSAQGADETHNIADVMDNRILLHLFGTVASPIAAQVGGHRAEPSLRQRPKLMSPGIPALGKAVAEDDERAFTLFGHV